MAGYGWTRAAARALMPWYVRMGLDTKQVFERLRRAGRTYRRSVMLRDYRSISGRMRYEQAVRAMPGDVRPGRNIISEVELKQPERTYRVFGEVDIYDWDRREWTTKNISFYDDYLRTKDEWSSEFVRQFGGVYARYGQSVQRVEIKAIEHNVGHLY